MSPRAKINQELETKEFLKLKTMHPQPFRRHGLRPKVQSFTVVDDNKGGLADNLTVSKHSKFCRFSQSHDVGYKHAYCQRSCAMKIRQRSDTKRLSCHERFQAKAPHNTTQFLINDHESRYRNCVYSKDSDPLLITKGDVENLDVNIVVDSLLNRNHSDIDEDRMPYTFDKTFELFEFEQLYNEMVA